MRRRWSVLATTVAALLLAAGCGQASKAPSASTADASSTAPSADIGDASSSTSEPPCELTRPEPGEPFERLRDYCFFRGEPSQQHQGLSEGVVPYAVRSKLYSDESDKFRFIVLPDGEKIDYKKKDLWAFPDGTIIVKTFYYPHDARNPEEGRRLLETRLLVKRDGEWEPRTYLWNEEQTKAKRHIVGKDVKVEWTNEKGKEITSNYRVPSQDKCQSCHMRDSKMSIIGPRTRQFNRPYAYASGEQNQLTYLEQKGLFDEGDIGAPKDLPRLPDPKNETLSIEKRARAYLEGNCAHCHNSQGGGASNSGLFLHYQQDDRRELGVCLRPTAAGSGTGGHTYDINPGYPEKSIMVHRMKSSDPEVKMPELPLRTVDTFGVKLITKWIEQMRPKGCENRSGG